MIFSRTAKKTLNNKNGFTLVELMVTVVISGIAIISIYSAYEAQQRSHTAQQQVTEMQQTRRVALDSLIRKLRMLGLNPEGRINTFELLDIRSDASGNGYIQFTSDEDEDGTLDGGETLTYSLYQHPVGSVADQDGIPDLALTEGGGGRQLVAESIEYMEFAYAFDRETDGDDDIDLSGPPNNNIIWAIDSDNDNILDTLADTNDDGLIDINDFPMTSPLPAPSVGIDEIRAIKVWLLARAKRPDTNYFDGNATYVIGSRRFNPAAGQENIRRRVVEHTVFLRNI